MKAIQQASATVTVPAGFSGWWCERCEKGVEIEDCLGSPAKCPKCHKPTAVWIPPSEPLTEVRERGEAFRPERKYVTKERGAAEFEAMKALVEDVDEARPDARTT